MLSLKEMKASLDQLGYSYHCKLNKEKHLTTLSLITENQSPADPSEVLLTNSKIPLCQNVDIIVPEKKRTADRLYQLQQFLDITGSTLEGTAGIKNEKNSGPAPESSNHLFVIDNELRQYRIREFIQTEISYVESLQALIKYVIQPLTSSVANKNVLNTYKCSKIFLNLTAIYNVNKAFLYDLQRPADSFGSICSRHLTQLSCYRKYLLGQHEAQALHTKEIKCNPLYRRFISQAKERPVFKRRRLQDVLLEPVQRISRYTLMFKDILRLTSPDHPDFTGLKDACEKVKEIATMADDKPTKAATMFLNLYQSVKDCPCSLVTPNRSLVTCVDAVEIQRDTNKPARSVTVFLFTDKIMVATRSPNQHTLEELDNWKEDSRIPSGVPDPNGQHTNTDCKPQPKAVSPNENIAITASITATDTVAPAGVPALKKEFNMKFKGWIDVEHVEIFHGNHEVPDSFLIHSSMPVQRKSERRDSLSSVTFEKYFRKGPRLYTIAQHSSNKAECAERFRLDFERSKAMARLCNEKDQVYEREWNGMRVYSNIYNVQNYQLAKSRNNITVLYVEDTEDVDLQSLFGNLVSPPWIIAVVQSDMRGYRFHICSRVPLPPSHDANVLSFNQSLPAWSQSISHQHEPNQTVDFEPVFWNNILLSELRLRSAPAFSNVHDKVLRNDIQRKSRSKSVPRPTSLTTISKLFNYGLPLSPTSPRTTPLQVTPTSSQSMPMKEPHDCTSSSPSFSSAVVSSSSTAPGSNASWNDSILTSCSSSSSTTSSATKTPILRRFASKSSNALYSTRKRHDSSVNLVVTGTADNSTIQGQQHIQRRMSPDSVTPSSLKVSLDKGWHSSLDVSQVPRQPHTASPATMASIETVKESNKYERSRSYSFSSLTAALQRSIKNEILPRPSICTFTGNGDRRRKNSDTLSSNAKNISQRHGTSVNILAPSTFASGGTVSPSSSSHSSIAATVHDLDIATGGQFSTNSSHCKSDTLSSLGSNVTKNSREMNVNFGTIDGMYDDDQEEIGTEKRVCSITDTQDQDQGHDQVLEVVAGAIENMGMDIHQRWRKMALEYQSLCSVSRTRPANNNGNCKQSEDQGSWQTAYAAMINETFTVFSDLTTELEQVAAIVNTRRNR